MTEKEYLSIEEIEKEFELLEQTNIRIKHKILPWWFYIAIAGTILTGTEGIANLTGQTQYSMIYNILQKPKKQIETQIQTIQEEKTELEQEIDSTDIWVEKAVFYAQAGELEQALTYSKKAINKKPDCKLAWQYNGLIQQAYGKLEEAIKSYDKVIRIDSRNVTARYNKAYALYQLCEYQKTIDTAEEMLKADSTNHEAWFLKGNAQYMLKQYNIALKSINKAVEIKPQNTYYRQNLNLLKKEIKEQKKFRIKKLFKK
ncbi:MAG: tetratricopeptide repeat protein [Nanoarchaeota archaeon]|nr:tetratricopeptide repeat protein [Nanoarchaeota archaeon]MBU1854722.1 tetratricopeptide repeat protein [Nanoarchaeota archaeon]